MSEENYVGFGTTGQSLVAPSITPDMANQATINAGQVPLYSQSGVSITDPYALDMTKGSGEGLTNTQASLIGAGIGAAGSLASGIGSSIATKRMQDEAFKSGMEGIDLAAARQAKSEGIQERAQDFTDAKIDFSNYLQDAAIQNVQMMRDFQEELEKVQSQRDAANKFKKGMLQNENFRDALLSMNRSR